MDVTIADSSDGRPAGPIAGPPGVPPEGGPGVPPAGLPDPPAATPLRALGTADPAGYRVLRETSASYRDGAEAAVLRLVSTARDLRSDSSEMVTAASGWAQRYHVDPARANILRCLDLPPSARVLEIGAGCGAITRYLGESCATVDSLEPVAVRAAAAAARTRDLPGVRVFVGELDDVPEVPAYDVVVVIGVLEYVGAGAAQHRPYQEFLSAIAARLVDGGTLVLAIENKLGVKYLAGAPEDHTDRVFDSIEGYPRGGHARTFSRRGLETLLRDAGLDPVTRTAFPDYKMTRAVFGDVPDSCRSLQYRVPVFPSPDWRSPRPRLADERALWTELVEAGLQTDAGNSFLVLAGRGDGPALWPAGRIGAYYTTDRIPALNTATVIETTPGDDAGSVRLRRTALRRGSAQSGSAATGAAPPGSAASGAAQPVSGGAGQITLVPSIQAYRQGTELAAVLARDGVRAWPPLAGQWLALLDAALASGATTAVDVIPHHLIVDEAGGVHPVGAELAVPAVTRDRLRRRGVLLLADRAAPLAAPRHWAPARTVGDLMRELGAAAGLDPDGSWIEQAITEEADLLTRLRPGPPPDADADGWRRGMEAGIRARVGRALVDLPSGERLPERAAALAKEADAARRAAAEASAAAAVREQAAREQAAREQAARTPAAPAATAGRLGEPREMSEPRPGRPAAPLPARVVRRAGRAAARLMPPGTRRRRLAAALLPAGTGRRRLLDRLRAG